MLWTPSSARRIAAALLLAASAAVLSAAPALAQAMVSVNPGQGAPGSQFRITLSGFGQCSDNAQCIEIDFVQGATSTKIAVATGDAPDAGPITVPPSAKPGDATVRAHSSATDDASTGFTVTGPAAATTTTGGSTTTTASTTTTTVAPTTTLTTVVPAITEPPSTTTTTIATKKSSSHSDVPRYIAVALVVIAAAATAGVDTQLRRAGRI